MSRAYYLNKYVPVPRAYRERELLKILIVHVGALHNFVMHPVNGR